MSAATQATEEAQTPAGAKVCTVQRFLFMTLDPVHVGAGGYRLSRVDMTIAREPGTNLPKIPGTSLAGAARSYAAMRYGKIEAAGQHRKLRKEDKDGCPIIYTFGTATEAGGGQAGTVSIGDAQILFFPVHSMAGPVWVSTPERVKEALGDRGITLPLQDGQSVEPTDAGLAVVSLSNWDKPLNLGWLLLETKRGLTLDLGVAMKKVPEWTAICNRIVLVTPKLFSQVVNSNLEVRTSVSIEPETGAAASGALFTYEAIPRAAWLWCDVVEDDYPRLSGQTFPQTERQWDSTTRKNNAGPRLDRAWEKPLDVVKAGLSLMEYLGVGGMGTRGFGRMRIAADREV